jgi:hypothetical protein
LGWSSDWKKIDIGGHGSNGSLINMVYNSYYGTGYNNSTLIEPKFEMNVMLYQSILNLGLSHVGKSHKR